MDELRQRVFCEAAEKSASAFAALRRVELEPWQTGAFGNCILVTPTARYFHFLSCHALFFRMCSFSFEHFSNHLLFQQIQKKIQYVIFSAYPFSTDSEEDEEEEEDARC